MTNPAANAAGQAPPRDLQTGRPKALWTAFGVVTVLIGLAVLFWPGITLLGAAVLFGAQMVVTGVFWLVGSFTADALGRRRWLLGVAGALAVVAGVLCLFSPFQTITLLALLLGVAWVVGGVAEVFHGFGTNGWAVFSGAITVIGGVVVLVWPVASLLALALLLGVVLLVFGSLAIAGALTAERVPGRVRAAGAPKGTAATAQSPLSPRASRW